MGSQFSSSDHSFLSSLPSSADVIDSERMSERADDDVRGEQRKAARQPRQPPSFQRGEGAAAMATVAERRSLPSPEIILGQTWSSWVDAVKLHGNEGAESEESFKECGKRRAAMRLCREDMPIFGQCPAQDDFYLVICSHCSQVVKPQAFQAHYERRHSCVSKLSSTTVFSLPSFCSRGRGGAAGGAGSLGSSSGGSNSTAPLAKDKLPHRKPHFPLKMLHNDILTPAVKVEKIHLKTDYPSSKLGHVPASSTSSSSSSVTVSSSPTKPGLNSPLVPKAQPQMLGHIPNGKSHPSSLDKRQDGSASVSSRRLYRRPLEREFNPDIHCGVLDTGARKPCTRSLTCKTHSLSQRRAVPGRSFDALLAEHKGRARDKELQHRVEPSQQAPPLRDPPMFRLSQDTTHGSSVAAEVHKPFALCKPKPHNHGLPRLNSCSTHAGLSGPGDPVAQDLSQNPCTAPTPDGARLSSDEGETEDREEAGDKLDCHYSGYHPRPAAYCTFGSRQFSRGCYSFDRRWHRVRCALAAMMDKHVNSLMWKKIPLVQENSSFALPSSHRSNSLASSFSPGFLSPSPPLPYGQSYDNKPVLSYGTTLNARATPHRAGEQLACGGGSSSRQVSSSSPQMPSVHSSSLPSTQGSGKPNKSRFGSKSFRAREPSPAISMATGGGVVSVSSASVGAACLSSGKKRKNSTEASSSSSSSSSSFRKNCAVNSGTSGSSFHSSFTSAPSSTASSLASFSASSSSSHSVSLPPGRSSLSLRQGAPGPAEPIKRMSVVMNSSDSTLSLGPFVHQGSDYHSRTDGPRLDSKRRKSSSGTSVSASTGPTVGGGGAPTPGRPKMAKSPAVNNIHSKHTRPMPGTPGLPNSSLIHQPKARP